MDADDGTGTGIDCIAFDTSTVAKDDNDFLVLGSGVHTAAAADDGLKALDPVLEGLHVWLVGQLGEGSGILACEPGHRDDDEVGADLEDVIGELEGIPWGLKLVRASLVR